MELSSEQRAGYLRRHWRKSPLDYFADVLKVDLWEKQREILERLFSGRGRVIATASHGVGKSYVAAAITNFVFDCFENSITITTAPTASQVRDVLWKDIRAIRSGRPGLLPKSPRMEHSASWFAVGMTAASGDAFQGRHTPGGVFLIFDEAVGVHPQFFDAAEGMLLDGNCKFLAICNPTDPGSKLKELFDSGEFDIVQISALDHPNISAGLSGNKVPFPGAITLEWVERAIKNWCSPIEAELATAQDFEFPPGSGRHYRPSAVFESRVLGRWPTRSIDSIWSDAHWNSATGSRVEVNPAWLLEVGVDVARFGDDFTSIVVRRGPCVLDHLTYNGNDTVYTCGMVLEVIRKHLRHDEALSGVAIKIDDDGIGGGVSDQLNANGCRVVRINAGTAAVDKEKYPNRRSELWFAVADRALDDELDLTRLSGDSLALLRSQLLQPKWRPDSRGRRVVEAKDELKKPKRMGRSPDDADALNLAFAPESAGKFFLEDLL